MNRVEKIFKALFRSNSSSAQCGILSFCLRCDLTNLLRRTFYIALAERIISFIYISSKAYGGNTLIFILDIEPGVSNI